MLLLLMMLLLLLLLLLLSLSLALLLELEESKRGWRRRGRNDGSRGRRQVDLMRIQRVRRMLRMKRLTIGESGHFKSLNTRLKMSGESSPQSLR